ncbi:hypothetical protein HZS55_05135 [Halosimplex rubrum]|uniref:Uncharacterized protein n=1 Tax=Halosimplex rubrum TaxID=869889 RepID=A0A7D5NYU8_9EURY|nr:hypothetical protein [Halosimplex rubrum]QLH76726.1 hypothetical protein HZS55_05135 [Halosimplex rubrum]
MIDRPTTGRLAAAFAEIDVVLVSLVILVVFFSVEALVVWISKVVVSGVVWDLIKKLIRDERAIWGPGER